MRFPGVKPSLLLAVCSQACAGPSDEAGFRGVVRDSATGEVVHDALVHAGDDSTLTDANGQFSLIVPAGRYLVRVTTGRHETYERDLDAGDRLHSFLLRRNAPFVHDVSIAGDGIVTATIEDLQSGSLLMNGPLTWVLYYSPTIVQSSVIYSSDWQWERLDERSWRVAVQTADPAITGVSWTLSDLNSLAFFDCAASTGACTEKY